MNNEKAVWELRLGFGTHEQAKDVRERIARVLCPDPDHAPPCPIPWSVSLVDESAIDPPGMYAELEEQARIESLGLMATPVRVQWTPEAQLGAS
jgi:hypothetical protein